MALNYSYWPVFPVHIPEENLMSSMRIASGYLMDDVHNVNGEGFMRPWQLFPGEAEEPHFSYTWGRTDNFSFQAAPSDDIVDRLPSDPFDMDMQTTFTAITGWIEDLERAYCGYPRANNYMPPQEGNSLFSGWSMIYNNPSMFQLFPNAIHVDRDLHMEPSTSGLHVDEMPYVGNGYIPGSITFDDKLQAASTVEERDMGDGSSSCNLESIEKSLRVTLGYLGVKELLSVEMVCKYLSSTIRGDPFLWKTIHIDRPLNERIMDDDLVQLVSRAQGQLKCLSLVECPKISDEGLRRSLEMNPLLTKLSVPGCTRISIECILNIMRTYNSNKVGGIKCLRVGGVYGVERKHFQELKLLLGADEKVFERKRHFYNGGNFYLPHDDDRPLDIEMCPRCENVKLVYDCPSEGCEAKDKSPQACRACTICIPRCAQCGRCINDTEFEETFCLELLCSACFRQVQNYHDRRISPYGSIHFPVSSNHLCG